MKKIGILGGLGWASTIDYYRGICDGAGRIFAAAGATSPLPVPPIVIESVVQAQTRALRGRPGDEDSWAGFDAVFRSALLSLQGAGCDFAVIASNTPHARFAAITAGVVMPVLSIFEAAAEAAATTGRASALVLGTTVTMQARDYAGALASRGIAANAPLPASEIARMQALIDNEFYGGASERARQDLLTYCADHAQAGDAILLACTELPLAFPDHLDDPVFESDGFLFVNPSAAHIETALAQALDGIDPQAWLDAFT